MLSSDESLSTSSIPSSPSSSIHRFCISGDSTSLSCLLTNAAMSSTNDVQTVLSSLDPEGRSPLHNSLLHANVACVQTIVRADPDTVAQDYNGLPCTHLSLALCMFEAYRADCEACLSALLDVPSLDLKRCDGLGRTVLHLACAGNLQGSVQRLLSFQMDHRATDLDGLTALHYAIDHDAAECLSDLVQELGSEVLELRDTDGNSLLHRAVRRGSWRCAGILLQTFTESLLDLPNGQGRSPALIAKEAGFAPELESLVAGKPVLCPWKNQTLIATHPVCRRHAELPPAYVDVPDLVSYQIKYQPENPSRHDVLLSQPNGALLIDEFTDNLLWMWDAPPACIADVLRVHDFGYVAKVKSACEALDPAFGAVHLDRDTMVSALSFEAGLRAAGAVIAAIDEVLAGRCRNAFCPIRPPGHHVGPRGIVASSDEPGSTGFCLLNNVAIGAAYAIAVRRDVVRRVAIVDFDVHHGNGTEAVLENLRPSRLKTEVRRYGVKGVVQVQSYKPWLSESDPDHILFVSTHGFGGKFYPGSGVKSSSSVSHPAGILNVPFPEGTSSTDFRRGKPLFSLFRTRLSPTPRFQA